MAEPLQLRSPISDWSLRAVASRALAQPPRSLGALEAACFEAHPDPQFVVNAEYEVVASNRAARALLERAQGPRALAESLVSGAAEFLRSVRAGIAAAIHTQAASGEIALSLSDSFSFSVRIVPLAPSFDRALLSMRPSAERSARAPRACFGFTPMENRVAELLCRGLAATEIAQKLGISIETVRCHLKQAFVKAGVHRQAELVAVMLGR
jgi:DNA-binding NarL/FixJ family response regulator